MTKRALLVAALIWDVPSLVRSEDEAAKAFQDSLSASPRHEPRDDGDPLNLASIAILAARQGDTKSVAQAIRTLGASTDPLHQVLTSCLRWWLVGVRPKKGAVEHAERVVGKVRGAPLRARLLAKLATFALDNHEYETSFALLQQAKKAAPPRSELRRAISIATFNEFGGRPTQADFEHGTADDITHYDWIDATALGAAQTDLEQRLADAARNPWSFVMRSGQTPIDSILAAELQATWAGALWKRRNIRKQVGAQLLLGGARNPDQAKYGLARWVQGGGRDIPQVVGLAESAFDGDTADALVTEVLGTADKPILSPSQVELAANLWDLLSEGFVEELLNRVPVDPGELGAPSRFLWGRAALRVPRAWSRAIRGLTPRQRVALAGHLPDEVLNNMTRRDSKTLAAEVDADEHASERSRAVAIVLKSRLEGEALEIQVAPSLAYHVALLSPSALSNHTYHAAELALANSLTRTLERAREGVFDLGAFSLPLAMTSVAEARGALDPSSFSLLKGTASDGGAPGNIRVDALVGMAQLAHVGTLQARRYRSLRSVPAQQGPEILDPISDSCLRAALLLLRAAMLTESEQFELLALSRVADARTRQLTASAAAVFLTHRYSTPVEAALLASLFDPDHTVIQNSLGVLGRHQLRLSTSVRNSVADRLAALFSSGPRGVRRRAVAAARLLALPDHKGLRNILSDAGYDRSWLVRSEVALSKRH
jgi:hypothetical protein